MVLIVFSGKRLKSMQCYQDQQNEHLYRISVEKLKNVNPVRIGKPRTLSEAQLRYLWKLQKVILKSFHCCQTAFQSNFIVMAERKC